MKIVLSGIDQVFDCGNGDICSVIIENQNVLYDVVSDIAMQIQGLDGVTVLSENNKTLRMDKSAEQIMQFIPFDLNRKGIVNKIVAELQRVAVDSDHYLETSEMLAHWERYCMGLEFELTSDIDFTKITVDSLIKAAGVEIADDYDSLAEKLIDYFRLVETYDNRKLFILVNLRSYLPDDMMQQFVNMVIERKYQVLLLEGSEHPLLRNERRYIVDTDRCVIC